jgi:hypothetical protein
MVSSADAGRSKATIVKILQSTHSTPDFIPPPPLEPYQVICGPMYPDRREAGRVLSIKTALGDYDIAEVVSRLPPEQRPELVVVRADTSRANLPRNIAGLPCPAVLVVGDTHHQRSPITTLLTYAMSEPYQAVILDYTRQHAHFFLEAGLDRVFWLPGFNIERMALAPAPVDIPMSFVGGVDRVHPRRLAVVEALQRAGLPLQVGRAPRAVARAIHARTRINLNCSLNGDLNLRALEVLASGGFLLTDRLGIESGFDTLFADGRHLVAYDDIEDCIEKSRRYLRDALSAAAIARAGHAAYETLLAPERIRSDFFALCESGVVRSEFEIGTDRRCGLPRVHENAALMRRIATYEVLQALQLAQETPAVLATPAADPYLLSDAADLVRVELAVDAIDDDGGKLDAFLMRAGVASRVRRLRGASEIREKRWDAVLATRADWRFRRYDPVFARNASALLIVSDLGDDAEASRALAAAGFKRLTDVAPVFTAPAGKRQS